MHLHTWRKNHTPENKEIDLVTAAFHPAKQSQETDSFLKTRFFFLFGFSPFFMAEWNRIIKSNQNVFYDCLCN